ncbi:hypothetical protein ABZS86_34955 [Streptomyces sp. NPDC005355]|uniref:hypothetical protein n=1 Tax=Streptomyces sp. NPDC005355 TaxID=3157038 RepID=UPI0033B90A3E
MAGLIGAIGGGFIGAAGAWGAALIAFRGALYQADRQGNATHEQWLRQLRRDASLAFISAARSEKLKDCSQAPSGSVLDAAIEQVHPAWQRLRSTYEALQLEASDGLLQPAEAVLQSGTNTNVVIGMRTSTHSDDQALRISSLEDWKRIERNIAAFVASCRKSHHDPAPLEQRSRL